MLYLPFLPPFLWRGGRRERERETRPLSSSSKVEEEEEKWRDQAISLSSKKKKIPPISLAKKKYIPYGKKMENLGQAQVASTREKSKLDSSPSAYFEPVQ